MKDERNVLALLLLLYVITFFVSLSWGQVKVSLISPTQDELTLLYYRLNRFVTASIVGAVLSCTALTLQTVTRNYLVDSGLLGVNSGAVLGKVLSMFLKVGPSQLFALAGSMIALIATFTLGSLGGSDILRLVVAGVVVNSVLSSAISLISLYLYTSAASVLSWTLGHIRTVSTSELIIMVVSLVLCFVLVSRSKQLDILTLSKEEAMSLGVNYKSEVFLLIAVSALAGSLISSIFGVFSFVGVAAPNMARRIVSGGHLKLFLFSSIIGALLMAVSDVIARTSLAGIEIPTGLVVSFAGAVFYLYFFWSMSRDYSS